MTDYEILNKQFPRLGCILMDKWGTRGGREFLCQLISDSRGGTRRGFDPKVASAIIRLLQAHDEQFPQFDDSDDVIIPFRAEPVRAKKLPDNGYNGFIRFMAYIVGFVLLLGAGKHFFM